MKASNRHYFSNTLRRLQATRVSLGSAVLLAAFSALFSYAVLTQFQEDGAARAWFGGSADARACADPHAKPDGGDCGALGGLRRPEWACYSKMRAAIPEFRDLYARRVVRRNRYGMRIDHCFALWYILRTLQPKVVIESGARGGQGTWLIRATLPSARVFSLDPVAPVRRLPGVEYLTDADFMDFSRVNWTARGVVGADALVFIDDHQSAVRRIFDDNPRSTHGFKRFVIEDNYPFQGGDALSLKSACVTDEGGRRQWRGSYRDNFARKTVPQTWAQHLRMGRRLAESLSVYYEFPPLASGQFVTRKNCDNRHISTPIVNKRGDFERLLGDVDLWEFEQYVHMGYAELY